MLLMPPNRRHLVTEMAIRNARVVQAGRASSVPECPRQGAHGHVVRDGWTGSVPDKRRPRWRCRSVDSTGQVVVHVFIEPIRRRQRAPTEHSCPVCGSLLEVYDGPRVLDEYHFPIRRAAEMLVALAKGGTYRQAAEGASEDGRRHLHPADREKIRKYGLSEAAGPPNIPLGAVGAPSCYIFVTTANMAWS